MFNSYVKLPEGTQSKSKHQNSSWVKALDPPLPWLWRDFLDARVGVFLGVQLLFLMVQVIKIKVPGRADRESLGSHLVNGFMGASHQLYMEYPLLYVCIYIWDYMVHIWVRNHLLSGMHIQVSNWPKKIYWKSKWIWNDLWDLRHSTSKPFVGRGKALLLKRNFGDMGWLAAKVQWSPLGPQCWDLLDVSLFQRQLCTLQEMTVEPSKLTCTHKTMRTPKHCKSRSHGPNS